MKYGTQLEHGLGKMFGYGHRRFAPWAQWRPFSKMAAPDTILPTITNIMSTVGLANPIHIYPN